MSAIFLLMMLSCTVLLCLAIVWISSGGASGLFHKCGDLCWLLASKDKRPQLERAHFCYMWSLILHCSFQYGIQHRPSFLNTMFLEGEGRSCMSSWSQGSNICVQLWPPNIGLSKPQNWLQFKESGKIYHLFMGRIAKSYCKGYIQKREELLWPSLQTMYYGPQ